jgi:hypothetical protein
MKPRKLVGALVLAWIALLATPALAQAKGPSGTKATVSLNQAAPRLGSSVTFSVSYPKQIKSPRVQVTCYQGSALVYGEAGPSSQAFLLGGAWSIWLQNGGPASCTSVLYYYDTHGGGAVFTPMASTSFAAAG